MGEEVGGEVASVRAAEGASIRWAAFGIRERIQRMRLLRHATVDRLDDIIPAVCEDTGKIETEALLTDILPTLEQCLFYEKIAARILQPKSRRGTMLFAGARAHVEYMPYGAVLVIAPWNNPFQLCMVPAVTALLCGNAVIIKPSERTPRVASELRILFDAAGFDEPLVRIVEGGPETAGALIAAHPDLVFFTGGAAGGREVLKEAGSRLIPVIAELGGKDPMIVFADADLDEAARAAVYGAFAHDGQHCIAVERLYVEAPAYDGFVAAVAAGADDLVRGRDIAAALFPETEARVRRQITAALESGARLVTRSANGKPVLPAVVADVNNSMALMREETFGPVLPVMSFMDESEAVNLANDCEFGLNASVWTRDMHRAARVASLLESGGAAVNGVLTNAGHPALPFGGLKRSGFGRYHGPEGLLAFVRPKGVVTRAGASAEINRFPYDGELSEICAELIRLRYGAKGGLLSRLRRWYELQKKRTHRIKILSELQRPESAREEGRKG